MAARQVGLPTKLRFAIEIIPTLRENIAAVWKPLQLHADVKTVDVQSLPAVDVVVGGPPCQPYCPGGLRGGLADARGHLFFSMVAFCEERLAASADIQKAVVIELESHAVRAPQSLQRAAEEAGSVWLRSAGQGHEHEAERDTAGSGAGIHCCSQARTKLKGAKTAEPLSLCFQCISKCTIQTRASRSRYWCAV